MPKAVEPPKPVEVPKPVKFDITGRMIQALRSLQSDLTFNSKYKNITVTKEKVRRQKRNAKPPSK